MGDNVIVAKVVMGVVIMMVNFVGGISVGPFQQCLKSRAGAGGRTKLKRFQGTSESEYIFRVDNRD